MTKVLKQRIVMGGFLCVYVALLGQTACTHSREKDGVSKAEGIRILENVLTTAKVSGSLEYSGSCDFGSRDFPNAQIPTKQSESPTIEIVGHVFRNDPRMKVWQDSNGMVRMVEKNVPQDLLKVRISHLLFKADYLHVDASYNSWDAMLAVLETPEVTEYIRAERIGSPTQMIPGMRPVPPPASPRLPSELENVTVFEALDYILKTFPGLWIYQDCESANGRRMVLFGIE